MGVCDRRSARRGDPRFASPTARAPTPDRPSAVHRDRPDDPRDASRGVRPPTPRRRVPHRETRDCDRLAPQTHRPTLDPITNRETGPPTNRPRDPTADHPARGGESELGPPARPRQLARLGHRVAASTVWKILRSAGIDPTRDRTGPTWIDPARDRTGSWTTQAARNFLMAFRGVHGLRYLIRDGAGQFTRSFDDVFGGSGVTAIRIPLRLPQANANSERGSSSTSSSTTNIGHIAPSTNAHPTMTPTFSRSGQATRSGVTAPAADSSRSIAPQPETTPSANQNHKSSTSPRDTGHQHQPRKRRNGDPTPTTDSRHPQEMSSDNSPYVEIRDDERSSRCARRSSASPAIAVGSPIRARRSARGRRTVTYSSAVRCRSR